MKSEIIYIEKENGSSHDGEAWIGKCFFSKSGQSVYFNGNVYKKSRGFSSNHFDIETGEGYWISGVKKDGNDRHKFGSGLINIDENVIEEYLKIVGETSLQKNKFHMVKLNNIPAKEKANEIENEKFESGFDYSTKFKNPKDLTDFELENLIAYYEDIDISQLFKKSRKGYKELKENLKLERENRTKNLA